MRGPFCCSRVAGCMPATTVFAFVGVRPERQLLAGLLRCNLGEPAFGISLFSRYTHCSIPVNRNLLYRSIILGQDNQVANNHSLFSDTPQAALKFGVVLPHTITLVLQRVDSVLLGAVGQYQAYNDEANYQDCHYFFQFLLTPSTSCGTQLPIVVSLWRPVVECEPAAEHPDCR